MSCASYCFFYAPIISPALPLAMRVSEILEFRLGNILLQLLFHCHLLQNRLVGSVLFRLTLSI